MRFITNFLRKREAKAKAKAMESLMKTLDDPKNYGRSQEEQLNGDSVRSKNVLAGRDMKTLIQKLSLKPTSNLELIHHEKAKAMEEIERLGPAATDPMLAALDIADTEGKAALISLLGRSKDLRAIQPIARHLNHSSLGVRYEAITALVAYPLDDVRQADVSEHLEKAGNEPDIDVRNMAKEILSRLGAQVSDGPWFTGANTWEQLAKAFIRLELPKQSPNYHGLAQRIQGFGAAERHAAWIRVAQELTNKTDKMRCYLEALYNDPDPTSIAWDWLNGQYDPMMSILGPHSPKTRKTVEELRRAHRPITQV